MSCRGIPFRVAERLLSHRVAHRHAADEARVLPILFAEALNQLKKYKVWSSSFPEMLRQANHFSREDLGAHFVWQDALIEFWEPFTSIQHELLSLHDGIRDLNRVLGAKIEPYIDPPAKAQIEFAIEDPKFFDRLPFDRKQIAYDTRRLQVWHRNFVHWVDLALKAMREVEVDV
jgi:hypothetical protein